MLESNQLSAFVLGASSPFVRVPVRTYQPRLRPDGSKRNFLLAVFKPVIFVFPVIGLNGSQFALKNLALNRIRIPINVRAVFNAPQG